MSYTDIKTALEAHLYVMPNKPPIAWENVAFDPVNELYFAVHFISIGDQQIGLAYDSGKYKTGIMQISVRGLIDTAKAAGTIADAVQAYFAIGTRLTSNGQTVRVTNSEIASPLIDKTNFVIPVSVYWQAIT